MSLIEKVKHAIQEDNMEAIFSNLDLKKAGIEDVHNNISNYDKKNSGSSNKNKKVLISRKIGETIYYSFDEKLFK